jgi:Kef-type K+ transport system membrane component KefB
MVEYIPLEVTLLLCAAMIGIVLAKRIGQSAIVGEILLGVLIGPTLLGWVHYDEPVRVLAELGAIFMLFTVGLNSDAKQLYKPKNIAVAIGGIVVPFALGWLLAYLFGYTTLEGLFIGTALSATSIAITARILQERGLLSTQVAKTIIGAAVVDDILGLVVLSIITGLAGTATTSAILMRVTIALVFVVLCVALKNPVNRFVSYMDKTLKTHLEHIGLFAALVVAFGYAALAQYLGLSSIIGAFLAGVTLDTFENENMRSAAHYLETIFAAVFFVSLGIVIDFTQLGAVWFFAFALIVVAVLSKFIGCFFIAKFAGHTMADSLSVGFGMVPRGEVAMIVGLLGLSAGILDASLYGAIILMAFVTTLITPLLLQWSLAKPPSVKL